MWPPMAGPTCRRASCVRRMRLARPRRKGLMDGGMGDALLGRLSKVMAYSVGRGVGDARSKKQEGEAGRSPCWR